MNITNFADIQDEFIEKVHDAVWCAVVTTNAQNRPRSRVLHPIWEGQIGWIATGRQTLKTKHLAHSPYVSLTYMKDPLNPVYVDCMAEWADDEETKQRIWDLFTNTPEPLGYDLSMFFGAVTNPGYGVLKLIPHRIELYSLGSESKIWRKDA